MDPTAVLIVRPVAGHSEIEIFQKLEPPQFLLVTNNVLSTSFPLRSIHPTPFDVVRTSMLLVSEAQLSFNVQVAADEEFHGSHSFPLHESSSHSLQCLDEVHIIASTMW